MLLLLTERHYFFIIDNNGFYPEMKKYCNMLIRHDHAIREVLHQMYMMCHFEPGMGDVSTTFSELGEGATDKIKKIQDDLNEISIPIHTGQLQIQVMKFMKQNISSEVYHFSDFHLPIPTSA